MTGSKRNVEADAPSRRGKARADALPAAADAPQTTLKTCVYIYKGGAAKTTITINMSAVLAHQGFKVLMIDLDPQCNLSQFWNPVTSVQELTEEDLATAATAQSMLEFGGTGTKVLTDKPHCVVRPTPMSDYVGDSGLRTNLYRMFHAWCDLGDANLLDAILAEVDVLQKCNPTFFKNNLSLLVGSPFLSKFESTLGTAIGEAGAGVNPNAFKKIGLIGYIMDTLAVKHKFDSIFLDVSPSNSALNQISALSCDYILPPCMASLYSCGSVYGLLTSVLNGDQGWLGKHAIVSKMQWDPALPIDEGYLKWRLPRDAPKLLPIMVTNYGVETIEGEPKPEPPKGKSKAKATQPAVAPAPATDGTQHTKQISFSTSQFIYTTIHYVDRECPNIVGNNPPPNLSLPNAPPVRGPKVEFEENYGRRVLPLTPNAPVSMPASEGLGRPFIELELAHFSTFYGFEDEGAATRSRSRANRQEKAMVDQDPPKANCDFNEEVALMRERYNSLAGWVSELLAKKKAKLQ